MSHDEHDAARGMRPHPPQVDEYGRPLEQPSQTYYEPHQQPLDTPPSYAPDFAPYEPAQSGVPTGYEQPPGHPSTHMEQAAQYDPNAYVPEQYTQHQEPQWETGATQPHPQQPDPYAFSAQDPQAPLDHGADPYAQPAPDFGGHNFSTPELSGHDFSAHDDLALHPEQQALTADYQPLQADYTAPTDHAQSFAEYPGVAHAPELQHADGMSGYEQDPYAPTSADAAQGFTNYQHGAYEQPAYAAPEIPQPAEIPVERSSSKGLLAVIALVAAAGVGGGSAFIYKTIYGGTAVQDGKPPVILSDKRPIKERPAKPGGRVFENGDKKVFARVGKPQVAKPAGSAADRVQFARTTAPAAKPSAGIPGVSLGGIPGVSLGGTPAPAATATRPEPSAISPAARRPQVATSPAGVRKVPTVTIRPDGTLAPPKPLNQAQPVLRPAATRTASLGAPVGAPNPAGGGSRQLAPAAQPRPVSRPTLTNRTAIKPVARPAQPKPVVRRPAPARTASLPPAAAPVGRGGYVAQISARKSRLDALAAFADLQQRYPSVLNGKTPDIQTANLGSRGTWYRVRVGPPRSKAATNQLCSQLKRAGLGSCLVRAY